MYGIDTQLIVDRTYFVAEPAGDHGLAGCGGWSKRATLYGGDAWHDRTDAWLDPPIDAAKIRAFFVHPDWARRGIASRLLRTCENAAQAAGFRRLELAATRTGVALYRARGYAALACVDIELRPAVVLPIVRMQKST